tara:strand:+ start:25788 stop:26189 length:402 start_codon:yes stop_codon:yes gene_type:complete
MAKEAPEIERGKATAAGATIGALEGIGPAASTLAATTAALPIPGARIAAGMVLVGAAIKGGIEGYQDAESRRLAKIRTSAIKEDNQALKAAKSASAKRSGGEPKPIKSSDDQLLMESIGGNTAYDAHQKQVYG